MTCVCPNKENSNINHIGLVNSIAATRVLS